MRATSAASAWRSWLPAIVRQRAGSAASRAISHCTVSSGHSGPEAMSPRLTTSAGAARSISAHTASSAGRLPWMSETMAMRGVVIWRDGRTGGHRLGYAARRRARRPDRPRLESACPSSIPTSASPPACTSCLGRSGCCSCALIGLFVGAFGARRPALAVERPGRRRAWAGSRAFGVSLLLFALAFPVLEIIGAVMLLQRQRPRAASSPSSSAWWS